jgi:hypothetical protein
MVEEKAIGIKIAFAILGHFLKYEMEATLQLQMHQL